ncbi:MAG: ABC transporter ATP-binding protein [Pelolinea sp.]|nr:ABC transporter ATP-binding protein [Pelolinea sp.]
MHGSGWHSFIRSGDEKPKVTWALLKRVLEYSVAYRWQIIAMLVLILASSGLSLVTPLIVRDLIDRTIPAKDIQRLIWLSLALLAVPALKGVISVYQRRYNTDVGEGVIYDLRVALYDKLQRMSLRFFTRTKVGEMMSRLNNDVIGAQNAISNTIVNIITNIVQAIVVFAVMVSIEWRLTLISAAIMPLFIFAARDMGNRLRDAAREQMEANAQMNAMMSETLNIGGALLVKLFGHQKTETARFADRAATVKDLGVKRAVYGSVFFVIIGLLSAIGTALVYGFGGYQAIAGTFTVGTIVAFGSYLAMLYGALQGLANSPVEFSTSVVSFERVFEIIDLPIKIKEKPDAKELVNISGETIFEHVYFNYDDSKQYLLSEVRRYGQEENVTAVLSGEKPEAPEEESAELTQARETALRDIDFAIKPGQLTALVGPSGAGKTTLTYLIPRLYDPSEGRILIDGYDLREVTIASLSAQIGMVTQETYLFHDTIRTNLLYAKASATQDEIEEAAKAANIHDFIAQLPDKYGTIVGERGYRLSGGERQRIALARVILKDPRILVLDEATSSLDSESEALIQEALKRVMAGRTSIVIAHRLSTILAADQILVINRGRIVERGVHEELLNLNGIYANLYHTQFKGQSNLG